MASPLLVTGAAGFIGSRFVESCNRAGKSVVSVDEPKYFSGRPEHAAIDFQTRVDRKDLFAWLEQEKPRPEAVVHLGACTDTTELDVRLLNELNLDYSKRLWRWCTEQRVPFVYASSAATYGAGEAGYDDDEAGIPSLRPLNPYGESKQAFDVWALGQARDGQAPPAWAGFKFFNVYGFGERHKEKMASVILHAFDQIRAGGRLKLFKSYRPGIADGFQARDFIFVDDVVKVLWFAVRKPIPRGVFNLGTGRARTYLDLGTAVFRALGAPVQIDYVDMPPGLRERYQYFTEAKMERLRGAGFRDPFTSLEDGVAAYVAALAKA